MAKGYKHRHFAHLLTADREGPNPGGNLSFVSCKNNFDTQIHKGGCLVFLIVCMNRKGEQWEKKREGAELKKSY